MLKLTDIKKSLFSYKGISLAPFSVLLVILLDIFLLFVIIDGVKDEAYKSPSVNRYYRSDCVRHFKNHHAKYDNFKDDKYPYIKYKSSYTDASIAPICVDLKVHVDALVKNSEFIANGAELKELKATLKKQKNTISDIQKNYNTKLFEMVAKESANIEIHEAKEQYYYLRSVIKEIESKISNIKPVEEFSEYSTYSKFVNEKRGIFNREYNDYKFWQPFYAYGRMLAFIVPLMLLNLLIFFRVGANIVKMISAHLLVLLTLPVIFQTLFLIYHILPKTILKNIVEFFVATGLLALYKYILIGLIVAGFALIIYYVQKVYSLKKSNKSEEQKRKAVAYSQCVKCGHRVDYEKNYCPNCANGLQKSCSHCGKRTIKEMPFCLHCGRGNSKEQED